MVSKDQILSEIQRLADGGNPPTMGEFKKGAAHAGSTAERKFGSWNDALRAAGFNPTISDKDLLDEIDRLATDDVPPSSLDYEDKAEYHPQTVANRFGSWNEAVSEAGYQPRPNEPIDKDEIIAEIQRLADGDNPPSLNEFADKSDFGYTTPSNRFGSWNKAVLEAGYTPWITDEDLLNEIHRLADGDEPPTLSEYNQNANHHSLTVIDRFGSWNEGVRAAGFEPRTPLTEDQLLDEIDRLAVDQTPPTMGEFNRQSDHGATSIFRRFDSWSSAVDEAGYTPHRRGTPIDAKDLLADLRENTDDIATKSGYSGKHEADTYRVRFGSFWRACVRAGVATYRYLPLTETQWQKFFQATSNLADQLDRIVALLAQFTGLSSRLIVRLSDDWISHRQRDTIITVPETETRLGESWTVRVPEHWSHNGKRETHLPGLLKWYFKHHESIRLESKKQVENLLRRISLDADLESRRSEATGLYGQETAPKVTSLDLRLTGGIRMAYNQAPEQRIRRHVGIKHTMTRRTVEDIFLWCHIHDDEFTHIDSEVGGIYLDESGDVLEI